MSTTVHVPPPAVAVAVEDALRVLEAGVAALGAGVALGAGAGPAAQARLEGAAHAADAARLLLRLRLRLRLQLLPRAGWDARAAGRLERALAGLGRVADGVAQQRLPMLAPRALGDLSDAACALGLALGRPRDAAAAAEVHATAADIAVCAFEDVCVCGGCRRHYASGRGRGRGRDAAAAPPPPPPLDLDPVVPRMRRRAAEGHLALEVDRADVVASTYRALARLDFDGELEAWACSGCCCGGGGGGGSGGSGACGGACGPGPTIEVRFAGESGRGEGLVRDWLAALFDALVGPGTALAPTAADARVVHLDGGGGGGGGGGGCDKAKVAQAWLAGCATAIAARVGVATGYHLSGATALLLQGRPSALGLEHVRQLDPQLARTLDAVLAADAAGLADMRLCFEPAEAEAEADELVPGARDAPVTAGNRALFVHLLSARRCAPRAAATCARAMRLGFLRACGRERGAAVRELRRPTPAQLNAQLGGPLRLPADDVARAVVVHVWPGVAAAGDGDGDGDGDDNIDVLATVAAFHGALLDMDDAARRRLLRFWTGSSHVGTDAAAATPLQLCVVPDEPAGRLPEARTCLRQLRLAVLPRARAARPGDGVAARIARALEGFDGAMADE
jgi:hypothetical protein